MAFASLQSLLFVTYPAGGEHALKLALGFPNPSASVLHITSASVFEKGFLYSINGSLIKTISEIELINKTIEIADLSNGNYYLSLSSSNKTYTTKFVKN